MKERPNLNVAHGLRVEVGGSSEPLQDLEASRGHLVQQFNTFGRSEHWSGLADRSLRSWKRKIWFHPQDNYRVCI